MPGFRTICGFEDLWASMTGAPRADARPVPLRPLLDTLGLGLELVGTYLARERPNLDACAAKAEAAAEPPDASAIARPRGADLRRPIEADHDHAPRRYA